MIYSVLMLLLVYLANQGFQIARVYFGTGLMNQDIALSFLDPQWALVGEDDLSEKGSNTFGCTPNDKGQFVSTPNGVNLFASNAGKNSKIFIFTGDSENHQFTVQPLGRVFFPSQRCNIIPLIVAADSSKFNYRIETTKFFSLTHVLVFMERY